MVENYDIKDLYADLNFIEDTTFPKKCGNCQKVYSSLQEYIEDTLELRPGISGLEETCDDDDKPILGLYRNCSCGSTLLNFFGDRRGTTEKSRIRRDRFGVVLQKLIDKGVDKHVARNELLKLVRGEKSEILLKYMKDKS